MTNAVFIKSTQLSPDIVSIWFEPKAPFSYLAGQFVELVLPHKNPDNRGIRRWFTLSSAPSEGAYVITTRMSDPSSSFKQTLQKLRQNDPVYLSQPMGDFVIPMQKDIPILALVGGIGITPIRSITSELIASKSVRNISILYMAHDNESHLFADLFDRYENADVTYTTYETVTDDVLVDRIEKTLKTSSKTLIYISGPELFTERCVTLCVSMGIPLDKIVTDYFHGYA